MLSRTERLNSTFSCSTTPTWRRSQAGSTIARSIAVDQHAAALRHVEALDQLGERALARAGGADDPDDLAGRTLKLTSLQDLRPVDAIAEADMLERDLAANRAAARRGPG